MTNTCPKTTIVRLKGKLGWSPLKFNSLQYQLKRDLKPAQINYCELRAGICSQGKDRLN